MSQSVTTGARLSTNSEGVWLTAALAGVTRLPAALGIRPIGAVNQVVPGHPGLKVLESTGICSASVLDADVERWMWALGRPDIQITVKVKRPRHAHGELGGPAPLFDPDIDPSQDPIAAYEALMQWYATQGLQRAAVLCRRDGAWVSAVRVWQPTQHDPDAHIEAADPSRETESLIGDGFDANDNEDVRREIDEVVITDLGAIDPARSVNEIIGHGIPGQFDAINVPMGLLEPVLERYQRNPAADLLADLRGCGLTLPQARVMEAVADVSATQITVTAEEFSVGQRSFAPFVVTVIDTIVGQVVRTDSVSADGQQWISILPATPTRVSAAVLAMCESLPSGTEWVNHRLEGPFGR